IGMSRDREERVVAGRHDVGAEARPPDLHERPVLPARGVRPLDARVDGEERGARHAVLEARPRRLPQRAGAGRQPLLEMPGAAPKREDLRARELEPRRGLHRGRGYPRGAVGFHPLSRLPQPWRRILDWVVTIGAAILFVLAFETEVAKPYRIPSSSMERTLLCAKPGTGCTGSVNDRVLVNRLAYDFGSPQRGQIVVFHAPAAANRCEQGDAGSTFVKRLVGLPGETVREDGSGFLWVRRPGSTAWTKLPERYLS